MQLAPYLHFNGTCEAAFSFYQKVLGGRIVNKMTYRDSPMADKVSPEWHNKIIHTALLVDDNLLMGSDSAPERYHEPKGFSVTIGVEDPSEAERIFHSLAEKGTVRMDIQETFWAERFGILVDQFGIPWMINCEKSRA
jgi:PhnB protein